MRYGLHLPQLGRAATPQRLVDVAVRAERLGFDDVWVSDHVAVPVDAGIPSFFPEPVPLLAAVAAHTSRVRLGTSVLVPAYRNPMHLAKQWATLDWLAPGRTILGVGAGWLDAEFAACGVPLRDRGRRLDDYLRGWRVLWGGGTEHHSEHFSFSGVKINPRPATPVPVWVGGSSPGALRRAAWCDGWHGTWAPLPVFRERLAFLRSEIERRGRDPAEVTVSMHMEVRLGPALSRPGYWSQAGDHYGDGDVATGSVEDLAERLAAYADAGLEHVLLTPQCRTGEEWDEHVSALATLLRDGP
ncbi:MAG TPA: TIGR03619 family F420-dependent LLM class oxidoreductase [Egibacteraceae bacterium]